MSNNKRKTRYDTNKTNDKTPEIITIIDNMINSHKNHINSLRQVKKIYIREIKNLSKSKSKKKKRINTGFAKNNTVPKNIIKFLKLDDDTELSRPEVTKRIYKELWNRGLYYKKDRRVLRVDDDVIELFGIDEDVNDITDPKDVNGFNFYNLQKLIAECYTNNN